MKIHQKVAEIQKNLMGMKLPKSGFNKFNKFQYYELEDILPAVFNECYRMELFIEFTFDKDVAQLKVRNWNEPGESIITSVPMPEIVPLNKGMNVMQSEGSYITYLKRYLLVNMFLILEKDIVDSTPAPAPTPVKSEETARETVSKDEEPTKEEPERLKNCINLAKKKQGKVTEENVKKMAENLLNKGLIDLSEMKEIQQYVDAHGVEA